MRVADQKDPIGIDLAAQRELADQVDYQRRHIVVIEAVPGIIGRPQSQVFVP